MKITHASDCAVCSEPAFKAGPCDCGAVLQAAINAARKSQSPEPYHPPLDRRDSSSA